MADNWKNNILPSPDSLDLGSLAYDENTSLPEITSKYTNLGSQINNLANAAYEDVHTRQVKLVGNDFGKNPMMYATYYQPATSDIQSQMRMTGTEKALEEGMERGKAAAEADLANAQSQYNSAMDAYKNAKDAFSNLQVSTVDPNMLPEGVTESEMMSYDSFTGDRATARENIKTYTDAQDVDWSKKDIWSDAVNKTIADTGTNTEGWKQEQWDAFWGDKEVGRIFTNNYVSQYIGTFYGEEKQQEYNASYNAILTKIDEVFDYINDLTDVLPSTEIDSLFYLPDNPSVELSSGDAMERIFDAALSGKQTEEERYQYTYAYYTQEQWIREHIAEEYQEEVLGKAKQMKGDGSAESISNSAHSKRVKELLEQNPKMSVPDASSIATAELGKEYYEFIQNKVKKEEANANIVKREINAGTVVETLFGFDINDMKQLTKWKKENPDEYESYKNQLAQVQSLSNNFEVADGERWYWTGNKYEQLKAGTPVFFAYNGALNADGSIKDDDLKEFVKLWNDFYSADVNAISDEELTNKRTALNDAYKKYMEHVSAATMVNSVFGVQITADVYNEIVASFDNNISQSDYEINGVKIKDFIKEFNGLSQGEKYRAWTDLVKAAYSSTGKFYRYTDAAGGIVAEDLNYKYDSDASGHTKLDDTNTSFGTGSDVPSKYANMTAVEAVPYFLAVARSMEQYNKGTTTGNIDPSFMDENFFQYTGKDLGQQVMGTVDFWAAALNFATGIIAAPINAVIGNDPDPTHNELIGGKGYSAANVIGAAFSGNREYNMENGWQSTEYLAALDKRNREYAASVINPILVDVYFGDNKQNISTVRGLGDAYTSEGGGIFRNWNTAWKTGVSFADMFAVNWLEGKVISGVATGVGYGISAAANSKAAARLQLSLLPAMIKNSSDASIISGKIMALSDKIIEISKVIDNIDDPTQLYNSLKSAISELDDLGIDTTKLTKLIEKSDDMESLKKAAEQLIDMKNSGILDDAVNTIKAIDNGDFGVLSAERAAALSSLSTNDLGELLTNFGEFAKAAAKSPSTRSVQQALANVSKITLASGETVSAFDATVVVAANRITGVMTLASATGIPAQSLASLPDTARQLLLRTLNGMSSASDSTITTKGLRSFLRSMTPDDFKTLVTEFVSRNEVNAALGKKWDIFDTYRAAAAAGWERSGVTALTREFMTDALTDPLRDFKRNVSIPQVDEEGNARVQTVQEYFTDPGNLLTNLAISTAHFGVSRIYNQVRGTYSAYAAERAWNAYNATGDKSSVEAAKAYRKAIKLNAQAQKYADNAWKRGMSYQEASKNAELSNKIVDEAVEQIFKKSDWDLDYGGKKKSFNSREEYISFIEKQNMPAKDGLFVIANSVNIKAINNYYMYKTQIGTSWNELGNIPVSTRIKLLSTMNKVHKANIESIRGGKGSFDEKNHAMYQLMKEAVIDANNAGEYGVKIRNLEKSLTGFFNNLEAMSKAGRADGTLKQQRIGYIPTSSMYFDGTYDDMIQSHRMAATRGLLHEGGTVDVSAANPAEPRNFFTLDRLITAMEKGEKTLDVVDKEGNVLRTVQLDYDGTNVLDMMVTYSNNYNLHKYVDPLMGNSRIKFGDAGLQNNHAFIIGNWNRIQKAYSRDLKYAADKLRGYDDTVNGKKVHIDGWYEKIAAEAIARKYVTDAQAKELFKKGTIEINVKEDDKAKLGDLRNKYAAAEKKMKSAKAILNQGDSPDSVYPFISSIFHLDKEGVPDVKEAKAIYDDGKTVAKTLVKAYTKGDLTEDNLRTGYTINDKSGMRDIMIDESMLEMLDSAAKNNSQLSSDLILYSAVLKEQAAPYELVSEKRGIKTKKEVKDYVNRLSSKPQRLELEESAVAKPEVKRTKGWSLNIKAANKNDYKAEVKGAISNKYIGYGDKNSSTAKYAKQAGKMANTGKYEPDDVVFVSMQGNRGDTKTRQKLNKQTIDEAVKALDAGATIVTDNVDYIMSSAYNVGEKNLYNYLSRKGYHYADLDVDGTVVGTWHRLETTPTNTPVKSGRMDFSYGNESLPAVKSKTTFDAIKKGERTSTTRLASDHADYWEDLKVGDIVEFKNKSDNAIQVRVTKAPEWIDPKSMAPDEKSALLSKEGWSEEGFDKLITNKLKDGEKALQFEYEYLPDTRLHGEAYLSKISDRITRGNEIVAQKTFGNDEGKVFFGGKQTKNAKTGEITNVGGVEVDAAKYYSSERRLGRNESGDTIEKTSESMIKTDERVAEASLYASMDVEIKKGEYAPTAFQKRYAESVIDRSKTELAESSDSYNGSEWILRVDKNTGHPELVKSYGIDTDISYSTMSKDGKAGTKKTTLAAQVKSLEQAGALGAMKDRFDAVSHEFMAGKYDNMLPDGTTKEQWAAVALAARDYMESADTYANHPKSRESLTKFDENGEEIDFEIAYKDMFDQNTGEQLFMPTGRTIDLDIDNVTYYHNSFKEAVWAIVDNSHPLHEAFTSTEIDELRARKIDFNERTRNLAKDLNNQAKALYDSGKNPEFNKMVDQVYQNMVARSQAYGGKAEDLKYQYLEALGVAAPGSGLNTTGVGGYGQTTRRYYAARMAEATGVEDMTVEGWSKEVTKMRLDAGENSTYATQILEGIERFKKYLGKETDDYTKLHDSAQKTNEAIHSVTVAKPSDASDNFENSVMAMYSDVYDRKAMSPAAVRSEIEQSGRDIKWRRDNLVSEALTGKKIHQEGNRVVKVGDSGSKEVGYSLNQMEQDLREFYDVSDQLSKDEFALQYVAYGAAKEIPGDTLPELSNRYNTLLENLYTKYAKGAEDSSKPATSKGVEPVAQKMTKEQFAANVVAKDNDMFRTVLESRVNNKNSIVAATEEGRKAAFEKQLSEYDEAGRTLLAKKIATEGDNAEFEDMYKAYLAEKPRTARAQKEITMRQFEERLLSHRDTLERFDADLDSMRKEYASMGGKNVIAPSAEQGKPSIFTQEQLGYAAAKPTSHWISEEGFYDVKVGNETSRFAFQVDYGTTQELSSTAVGGRFINETGDAIDINEYDAKTRKAIIEGARQQLIDQNSNLAIIHESDVNTISAESQPNPRYDWSKSAAQNVDENGNQIEPYLKISGQGKQYSDVLQDLGDGYKLVGYAKEDEPLSEVSFAKGYEIGEVQEDPKLVAQRALAQYADYTKKYNPAKELKQAQKDFDSASKEIESIKKKGEKVSAKVKKGTLTIDDLAKKTLSEEDYLAYKQDVDDYKAIREMKPTEKTDFYQALNGKYKIVSGNLPTGYTTIKNLLDMLGYDSKKFNHDISEGRVYTEEEIAKDYKDRKAMMKEVNKNLRKGNVRYRNVEEYKNPTALDIKSRTATINNLLAFCKQASDVAGLKKGEIIDAANIAIDKNYADMLYRISREGVGPTNVKGYIKKAAFEITDWNKFIQDFQLAGGASYVNAMTIAQMRGAILSNPTKMAEYLKLVVDFKDDDAVAHFVAKNGARLSEIAMKVGDTSILTDFQAAASDRPGFENNGTWSAATYRMIDSYHHMKGASRTGGEKYDFAKDTIQHNVDALFTDATFNRMLPVLRAKMLIANYDNATRALKRHFKNFRNPTSSVDEESLADAAAKYAYARTTAFFEPNKTSGGLFRNKSINETLENIYDDNLRRFLSGWTGAKDEVSIGQMASNCFFALGYKQRMIQPLAQGTKSMFGIGNIMDRLSMIKAVDEATPDLLDKLGTQFMQAGNRQQIRSLGVIAIGAFITAKSLGLATAWDDLSFTDEADGEFKVPDILKKFQTIGQIWIPNAIDENGRPYIDPTKTAYNIDTMSSIFTLPNVGWKTVDRMFNPNAYYSAPQRGFGLFGQELGINAQGLNDVINQPFFRAIGDELIGSNLLSPYKAMYEVLVDSSYYGNNIWEKKWLSDGSENPNYDPARNIKASFYHILGLDNYRTLSPRKYNDYVKGYYTDDYKAQDQIGSISGAGILQHEYLTAVINILEGDALEGVIEAGELPIKKQKFSSTARTDFNTRVKNIIAEAMAEYNNKTDGETNADVKDAAYADAVKKSANAVAAWSAKYDFVLGRDQSLVPYVTRSMMAVLSGEYDDRLDYIQNTYWKASQIAQIEAVGPAEYWLDDADVDEWIKAGKTTEEFAAEKNKRHEAYNQALDDEYRARKALHDAGIDNEYLAGMSLQNLKAEQRAVNRAAYTQAMGIVNGKIGEFDNFKEMKAYYESQIDAATTKKAKAKLANMYNTYLTDALAPVVEKYGAGIISDGYYNNNYLSNHLADYVIIPADKYYTGKTPRASYLRDLFGVGYKNFSNEPSDDEVIEGYTRAVKQMKAGNSASAVAALDRTIDAIKKGQLHVTDADYNKIIRMRALLSARSK